MLTQQNTPCDVMPIFFSPDIPPLEARFLRCHELKFSARESICSWSNCYGVKLWFWRSDKELTSLPARYVSARYKLGLWFSPMISGRYKVAYRMDFASGLRVVAHKCGAIKASSFASRNDARGRVRKRRYKARFSLLLLSLVVNLQHTKTNHCYNNTSRLTIEVTAQLNIEQNSTS